MAGGDIIGECGGTIPGSGAPAFTLSLPDGVADSGADRGAAWRPQLSAACWRRGCAIPNMPRCGWRIATSTSWREAVARATGAALLVAHAPRAMLDLNRATDDMDWAMVIDGPPRSAARHSLANRRARSGLGLVPRRLPGLGEVWKDRLSRAELDARIAGIHAPYHAALAKALGALRDRWGAALLIDLHSMPPLKPRHPEEPAHRFRDRRPLRGKLRSGAGRGGDPLACGKRPRRAAHNRPYAGGYVLDRHGAPARGIHALQLEVCRSRYLDARFDEPSARLAAVGRLIAGLVRMLADEVATLGRYGQGPGRLPIAAE